MAYGKTERTAGGIDWDAAERDFIENTSPRTGYREFAESAKDKIWSGKQSIPYAALKDVGKERMWLRKRAEFQREKHASLFVDAEIVYGFIMNILVRDGETMSSVDLARLTNEMIKLQELLMHHEPAEERVDDREFVTRDELLDEFERWERPTVDDLLRDALSNLEEEGAE